MTRRYTIAVTAEQAHIISQACDLLARLGIGQWYEFLDYLPGANRLQTSELRESMEPIIGDALEKAVGVRGWRSSLGVGSERSSPDADNAYDLHAVIRHRLAWDRATDNGVTDGVTRNWAAMMGVNYDEPMHWGKEPLAEIAAREVEE